MPQVLATGAVNLSVMQTHGAEKVALSGPPGVHYGAAVSSASSAAAAPPPTFPQLDSLAYDNGVHAFSNKVSTCLMEPVTSATACATDGRGPALPLSFPLRLSRPPSRAAFAWADESPDREVVDIAELAKYCDWISPRASPEQDLRDATFRQKVSRERTLQAVSNSLLPHSDKMKTEKIEDCIAQIPLDESGELSSIGSISHLAGRCQPCLFWFQASCGKGVRCSYCHLRHPGQKKKRIRMSKKVRLELQAMNASESPVESESDAA